MSNRLAVILGAFGTGITAVAQEFVALACGVSTLIILAPKVAASIRSLRRRSTCATCGAEKFEPKNDEQ